MKKNGINFKLNDNEKIVIELEEPLGKIHCCSFAPIYFIEDNTTYLLANDSIFSVEDQLRRFINILNKVLHNSLTLDKSLISSESSIKDIGYFFNEHLQGKPGSIYVLEKNEKYESWVGYKYMLWGVKVASWFYNNSEGDIILEITPCFPGERTWPDQQEFSPEEIENSNKYQQWIKNYKPILIRKISKEIVQQWLKQATDILQQIEQ